MKSYVTWTATKFLEWVKRSREEIERKIGPDYEDYPDVVIDTLFGEVVDSDMEQCRNSFLHAYVHEKACAASHNEMRRHYAARAQHHEERAELFRQLLIDSIVVMGDGKWKSARGFGSLSSRPAADKPEVVDVNALPREYLKAEPSMSAINDALKSGKEVPGVRIIPGSERDPVWTIRPSGELKEAV